MASIRRNGRTNRKHRFQIAGLIIFIYASITVLTIKNNLASDGYLELGFPFIFFRTSHAKMDAKGFSDNGFLISELIFDVGILTSAILVSLVLIRSMHAYRLKRHGFPQNAREIINKVKIKYRSKNIMLSVSIFLIGIFIAGNSCSSKVYSDEKMKIDFKFLSLFNSVLSADTMCFKNSAGKEKKFVITGVDSVISNRRGWFTNEQPYKLLRMKFRELGQDTTQLDRDNEIFVNKSPATDENSLCIKFNNLYYYTDNILPILKRDTFLDSLTRVEQCKVYRTIDVTY